MHQYKVTPDVSHHYWGGPQAIRFAKVTGTPVDKMIPYLSGEFVNDQRQYNTLTKFRVELATQRVVILAQMEYNVIDLL